jgi:catechol 2,3-dioxygenase-like lactoylglutathione lyase family enzyme
MKLFSGLIVVAVRNLEAASAWYQEKFDLRYEKVKPDVDESPSILLVSREGEPRISLMTKDDDDAGEIDRPIMDTASAAKAREWLLARGVEVGPVQTDRQGTHFVEMRDLENNMIEICEEP